MFIQNLLAVMMIQLSQSPYPWTRNDLLRECNNRPELSSPAWFSIHSAYEQKQSYPRFLVFGKLPDFSRSLRYSRSVSSHCLLKVIISSSVGVQGLKSIQHGEQFQRESGNSDQNSLLCNAALCYLLLLVFSAEIHQCMGLYFMPPSRIWLLKQKLLGSLRKSSQKVLLIFKVFF